MFVMAYPPYIRQKARSLRRERCLTIDEIAERLLVSRTSVYEWVRNLPYDARTAKRTAAQQRAAQANSARARERREEAYRVGQREFVELIGEPNFRDFLCLYLAEGYKRSRNEVALTNSDVAIVRVAHTWMRELSARKLNYAIQYHADQDQRELRRWWARQLEIDPERIGLQRKSNSGQLGTRTWRSPQGVLTVRTGDTYFRARLQAWLDLIRSEWL